MRMPKFKDLRQREDGMTLAEVVTSMTLILFILAFSAVGFSQIQKVQEIEALRSIGQEAIQQQLDDYEAAPFAQIGLDSSLTSIPVASGGRQGESLTYLPPGVTVPEDLKFGNSYINPVVNYKSDRMIGTGQYTMTTYVTTPPANANLDYQPVRATVELNLGDAAGVVKDSRLIYPEADTCPPKRFADTGLNYGECS